MRLDSVPWLDLLILTPLAGAVATLLIKQRETAHRVQIGTSVTTMVLATLAWLTSGSATSLADHGPASLLDKWVSPNALILDELSAPLVPLSALIYLVIALATVRTKYRAVSFPVSLVLEAVMLATLSCREPWGIIALSALSILPPLAEFRRRGRSPRVFLVHMGVATVLLVLGWSLVSTNAPASIAAGAGALALIGAVFIRAGIAPFHCWVTDLFENITLGTSLLFVTPMTGAYLCARLLLPVASNDVLRIVTMMALATTIYAAGMALVQIEVRRFFCYLFLSHSALVLVGMGVSTPMSLTGALSVWLSVGISLAGFGLTLRAIEARMGRLSLRDFHGLYEHIPKLAVFFLVTGLASVGFPGTIGFITTEILVDSVVQAYPTIGLVVVLAAALNGIAVMHAYFRLFTGRRHMMTIPIGTAGRERLTILVMTVLIIMGGLVPQPGIASRYHAAVEILAQNHHGEASPPHADGENGETTIPTHMTASDISATHPTRSSRTQRKEHDG